MGWMPLVSRHGGVEVKVMDIWKVNVVFVRKPDGMGNSTTKKKNPIRLISPRIAVMYVLQPERLKWWKGK